MVATVALAVAAALVALFQWAQLVAARSGGSTVCSINETLNCVAVWSLPFASFVHRWTGLPIAGWGLVWALSAAAQGLLLLYRAALQDSEACEVLSGSLRWTALIGVLASGGLAAVSFASHLACPTCLVTYALVGLFAAAVHRGLPRPWDGGLVVSRRVLWSAALPTLVAFAALLVPGLRTPHGGDAASALPHSLGAAPQGNASSTTGGATLPGSKGAPEPSGGAAKPGGAAASGGAPTEGVSDGGAAEVVAGFTPEQRRSVADAIVAYRSAPPVTPPAGVATRQLYGPKTATVKLVEWTDIRCSHCRHLVESVGELKRLVPSSDTQGRWSVEPRHFPLDGSCNPHVQVPDATGVRCLAARVQICLEGQPDYWDIQRKLFEAQASLDGPDKVFAVAGGARMGLSRLRQCVGSPETAKKLAEDIEYASAFHPSGTPVLAINGREAPPSPPFLLLMILLGGKLDAPILSTLTGN
jgi:serine/threonine-protein kinase